MKWLDAPGDRHVWDFAFERAKRTGEPIMAYVFVEHMPLCQVMERQTFRDPQVGELSEKLLCIRINALERDNKEFLEHYGVGRQEIQVDGAPTFTSTAYPQTLFIASNGELAHIAYGFAQPEELTQIMGKALQAIEISARLKEDANDPAALAQLGALYVELQRYEPGREALEAALKLDADGQAGVAETALLDLAVVCTYEEDPASAVQLVAQHIERFAESDLRCKARYLLGGAHLAVAHVAEMTAQELEDAGDEAGTTAARQRAAAARTDAIGAWEWFEPKDGVRMCTDPECEWSAYSLGALAELRAETTYTPVAAKVDALMAADDYLAAVQELQSFVKLKDHQGTEAWCSAEFLIGECLMKAGKRGEALKQWRSLENRAEKDPCGTSPWRAEAMGALQEAGSQR